ncbi:Uncharacterised protein g2530 [Pycnogonum litorale]
MKTLFCSSLLLVCFLAVASAKSETISLGQFYIESHNYKFQNVYDSNIADTWTVVSNGLRCLKAQVAQFDIDGNMAATMGCTSDIFTVTDASGPHPFCGKLSNGFTQTFFFPASNQITITFVTDAATTKRGFRILMNQVTC